MFTDESERGVINSDRKNLRNQGIRRIMSVQENEVHSLVPTPVTKAPGNGKDGNLKVFGDMPLHSQLSMFRDLVSWRNIKPRDFFFTNPSLQDGHGGIDTQ